MIFIILKYIYKKMKLNTLFLILLLILSIKTESILDQYSIERFKEYLKRNGLLEIIISIKNTYGQDVAIISCEELNKKNKGNCKKLVTDMIKPPPNTTHRPSFGHKRVLQKIKCTKGFFLSPYIKQSNPNSAIKWILRRKFNENQTNLIFIQIIKRVCKE